MTAGALEGQLARLALFGLAGTLMFGAGPREADAKGAGRLAWVGLSGGPLAPAKASLLEGLLVDELDGYDSFRLVDAGGHPLDERLLAGEAARMSKLVDEGVDHLLNFRHEKAVQRLDQAIEVFESRLTALGDHELLHEALLAKAEALFAANRPAAAEEALKSLAALGPRKGPTPKTHPAKFLVLWDRAVAEAKSTGRLRIRAAEPACALRLDGKPIGAAPAELQGVAPGKHYLVARWPFFVAAEPVQVTPGRELELRLDRAGPAERARGDLLGALERRSGPEAAVPLARRIADLAAADELLVAAVRGEEGALYLYLSRHDAEGRAEAVARTPLAAEVGSESVPLLVRRLGAALFVDRREGAFELSPSGEVREADGLAWRLWGRSSGLGAPPATLLAGDGDGGGSAEGGSRDAPPEAAATAPAPPALTQAWWFWAGLGVAAAGVVVGGALMVQPAPSTTRISVELPPGGGS